MTEHVNTHRLRSRSSLGLSHFDFKSPSPAGAADDFDLLLSLDVRAFFDARRCCVSLPLLLIPLAVPLPLLLDELQMYALQLRIGN